MSNLCFKPGCKHKAQYLCLCLSSESFCCEIHIKEHLKILNRSHAFSSVMSELRKWTKDGILKFLTNENKRKNTLKEIALGCINKNSGIHNSGITKSLMELDLDLTEIDDLIIKITQASEEEEISLLNSLTLPPDSDPEKVEETLPNGSESNIKLFCRLGQLRNKKLAILNRANNDFKTEQDFRRTCELYENNANHWLLRQAYKEYINSYRKITSLYCARINSKGINLFKYDTESEKEYVKILENPYGYKATVSFTIQLQNGDFFVYGINNDSKQRIAFIIDSNYRVRKLPIEWSQDIKNAIYYNRSIYCFGNHYISHINNPPLFTRFDLDKNRWIKLAQIKNDLDNMIIFNGNILIPLKYSCDILLYSIDIDSFSIITYKYRVKRKWEYHHLINSEERLYLIERYGWIYESGVNDEYNWKKISFSGLNLESYKVYCLYNKGAIYLLQVDHYTEYIFRWYLKFDLGKKEIIEIACYDDHLALQNIEGKLKVIEGYRQNIKIFPYELKNRCTLYHIFLQLRNSLIEVPDLLVIPIAKGYFFFNLGWYPEAIECYNEHIQFHNGNADGVYLRKGKALHMLGRNIEALECYSGRFNSFNHYSLIFCKGLALHRMGRNLEAIKYYDEMIRNKQFIYTAYFRKGITLHDLGEKSEAMENYNLAKLNDPIYFLYHAYLLKDLGQEEEAVAKLDKAYSSLMASYKIDFILRYNCLKSIKMLCKLLKSTVGFKKEIEKIRNSNLKSPEMLKEAEEQESIINLLSSQLIKRAVESLDFDDKYTTIEEIQQITKEVSGHQKEITDKTTTLSLFLSFKDEEHNKVSINNQIL